MEEKPHQKIRIKIIYNKIYDTNIYYTIYI